MPFLKILAVTVTLVALTAAPADAAQARKHKKQVEAATTIKLRGPAASDRPGPVYAYGAYMGDDPDPNIRFQLLRDAGARFDGAQ